MTTTYEMSLPYPNPSLGQMASPEIREQGQQGQESRPNDYVTAQSPRRMGGARRNALVVSYVFLSASAKLLN